MKITESQLMKALPKLGLIHDFNTESGREEWEKLINWLPKLMERYELPIKRQSKGSQGREFHIWEEHLTQARFESQSALLFQHLADSETFTDGKEGSWRRVQYNRQHLSPGEYTGTQSGAELTIDPLGIKVILFEAIRGHSCRPEHIRITPDFIWMQ